MLRSFSFVSFLITITSFGYSRAIPCLGRWDTLTTNFESTSRLDCGLAFGIQRATYVCRSNQQILRTDRSFIIPQQIHCSNIPAFETCEGNCELITDHIELNCTRNGVLHSCSFNYSVENCNILHWGSWEEVNLSCTGSNYINRVRRKCLDCDDKEVEQNFCVGNSTNEFECEVFWSEWGSWSLCKSNNTSANGTRTRTRSCHYENDSEIPQGISICPESLKIEREACHIKRITTTTLQTTTQRTITPTTTIQALTSSQPTVKLTVHATTIRITDLDESKSTPTTSSITSSFDNDTKYPKDPATNAPTTETMISQMITDLEKTSSASTSFMTSASARASENTIIDESQRNISTSNPSLFTVLEDPSETATISSDRESQNANSFLDLFLWVTIPIGILFVITMIVLIALIQSKINCTPNDPENASSLNRNVIGPLNGDLYSSVVRK